MKKENNKFTVLCLAVYLRFDPPPEEVDREGEETLRELLLLDLEGE